MLVLFYCVCCGIQVVKGYCMRQWVNKNPHRFEPCPQQIFFLPTEICITILYLLYRLNPTLPTNPGVCPHWVSSDWVSSALVYYCCYFLNLNFSNAYQQKIFQLGLNFSLNFIYILILYIFENLFVCLSVCLSVCPLMAQEPLNRFA